jgi:HEAT repeat protein
MTLRFLPPLLLAGMVGLVSFDAISARTTGLANPNHIAAAADEKPKRDAADQLAELIAVVESGEIEERELAMRALAEMGSRAVPAITALSKKLSDPDHAIRSAAIDALVAIGDRCVVPVRGLLDSPSARTRAAAAQVLGRLKKLDLDDLTRLATDADPRVRAVAVNTLATFGKPGVPSLAKMLDDPEVAVSVEAAFALQTNRADASIAIPRLARALARRHLGVPAVEALSAYGIEARQAVPAIIRAHPLGRAEHGFGDVTEQALEHVGPPREEDVPLLCEHLVRNEEARMVVANSLGLLGLKATSAADALEAAAERSIKDYVSLKQGPKLRPECDNTGRTRMAAEHCATAVWDVTHDAPRFFHLLERLTIAAGEPLEYSRQHSRRALMDDLSTDARRLLETMLRHADVNVQQTALAAVSDLGRKAEPLKKAVLDLARGTDAEVSHKAIWALAAIGPAAGTEATPILLAKFREGVIPLGQFAGLAGSLEIRSQEAQAILERGVNDKDHATAVACATALCITSNEPLRVARLVIDTAGTERFTNRDAIDSLARLKGGEEVIIPFLVQQLASTEDWTPHEAMDALGDFGPRASGAIAPLKKLFHAESPWMRLRAAKAVFLISGELTELEKQLVILFAKGDYSDRHEAMKLIVELKSAGGKFVPHALAELRRSPPDLAEEAIAALEAIGTPEAVAGLRKIAESSDWLLRSRATRALEQLCNAW